MEKQIYTTDPKEVYPLEFMKLQRPFEGLQQIRADAGQMEQVDWRQFELLRYVNFLVMEALQTGSELFVNNP